MEEYDIPLVSTTWVSYMLDLLYFSNTVPKRQTSLQIYMRVPFLELDFPDFPVIPSGVELVDKLPAASYQNPSSCSVGAQDLLGTELQEVFGPWYDHVYGYWEQRMTYSNIHYMFFQDIMEDTGHELERLCAFLGISASAEERERITKSTHFDAMKQNNVTNYSDVPIMDFKISMFMRKGTTWVSYILDLLYFGNTMDLPRPEMFDFHGVHMTHYFTDNWEKVQNFKARPNDIVVATYPKSGTTWVSYILDLLHFRQTDAERENTVPLDERVPFLEFFMPSLYTPGTEMADMLSTLLASSKLTFLFSLCPSPSGSRAAGYSNILRHSNKIFSFSAEIVYVARNAKDNVVSYFHFDCTEKIQPEPGDWKSFLQRFKDGKMVFGSWYDHVCGWWEKKQMYSNIHYMFFEDLVEDTGREIRGLCSFLGLSPSEDEREKIRGAVQFDVMKANPLTNLEDDTTLDFSISQFMRKGKVGDWKNHFTVAQNEQFDEHYKQMMKNATLQFRTEI
ncbi:hypothetical protein P4O66_017296 [Electrophorus voltai]|uniref:Sulfotransferase n=1 Tax=Electrophorus voltai TaxID=2609070 RepID=A0AAD9DPA0_9TELE|nr:hypothetical protein P4O66_017296 [Electrophorus voltai]